MAFVEVKFWVCNMCHAHGPEFEGTAEAVLPRDWWCGELSSMPPSGGGCARRVDIALCPECANQAEILSDARWV